MFFSLSLSLCAKVSRIIVAGDFFSTAVFAGFLVRKLASLDIQRERRQNVFKKSYGCIVIDSYALDQRRNSVRVCLYAI